MALVGREIKKLIFYRKGLLFFFAIFMVYIYRNTIAHPWGVYDLFLSIPVIILFFILFYSTKSCVYLVTIWIPLRNLITGGVTWGTSKLFILPPAFKYLDSAILAMLTLRWIIVKYQRKEPLTRTPMDIPMLLLGLVTLISAVANLTPPEIAILNLRTFVQYALLYYAIVQLDFDDEFLVKNIKFFLVISMVQTLSSLLLFMSEDIQREHISKSDFAVGTLSGGTNLLALYEAMLMCITVGLMKTMPEKIKIYLPLFFWYMISFFTASGRSAIYFFPIGLFFIMHQEIKSIFELVKSYVLAVIVVVLCIFFFTVSGVKEMYYGEDLYILQPSTIVERKLDERRSYGRMYNYKMGWKILNEEGASVLLGVGPGMYVSNTGIYFNVPLSRAAQVLPTGAIEKKQKQRYPPDLSIVSTEMGLLGLAVFCYIYWTGFRIMRFGMRYLDDPFWKGICIGNIGLLVILCISIVPERAIEVVYMQHIFWFMSGVVQRRIGIEQEKRLQSP